MLQTYFDYQFGLSEIIPSANNPYSKTANAFRKLVKQALTDVNQSNIFPTKQLVFLLILQFFSDQKEYDSRDVDNMCKMLLDILKGKLFTSDSQVKTLLVSKQIDSRVPVNFFYVGMKMVNISEDTGMIKVSKKEAIQLYQRSATQQAPQ